MVIWLWIYDGDFSSAYNLSTSQSSERGRYHQRPFILLKDAVFPGLSFLGGGSGSSTARIYPINQSHSSTRRGLMTPEG